MSPLLHFVDNQNILLRFRSSFWRSSKKTICFILWFRFKIIAGDIYTIRPVRQFTQIHLQIFWIFPKFE